jgi:hypothetical protein
VDSVGEWYCYHGFVVSLVCGGLGDESWSWRRNGGVCSDCGEAGSANEGDV